ncbi:SpoIIIAH-like family protein [Bacillus xiapuensis]|uniref:SpoIIIAH-like family protein n=1 Tax=Bacillus xiapuensis TaxID=2014075 RepID=UPI000C249111|nr:SpoIIIAH-like family protein [Bacillus xiapuensis]
MLLKKQTVWLLTMVSLVVVLSVYYITSPEQLSPQVATKNQEEAVPTETNGDKPETAMPDKGTETGGQQAEVVTEAAGDEAFDMLRLEMQDERNKLKEELTAKVASAELSVEDKNTAYEEMEQLTQLSTKESVLETLIKSKGYKDALVRADGDNIRITVKSAEQHSAAAANEIIRLAKDELGKQQPVAVEFQPVK